MTATPPPFLARSAPQEGVERAKNGGPIDALLVLADGTVFEGEAFGAVDEVATGEVVFNTVLAGCQEVITDPSYAGQVIAFT